jgi:hypothetical protein
MDSKTKTGSEYSTHIDETIKAIEDHVDKGTTTVQTSISSWIKTLGGYPELKDIAADLEDLKEAISDKNGKKIVDLMTKLGTGTTEAAANAEGSEGTKIKALGKALTAGAKAISKLV